MENQVPKIPYDCPYCTTDRKIETTATAPYVRGFLIAYSIGYKSYIGCVSCVKKKVLGEAGLSALVGWFSITSLFINPFMILYNLIQGIFIKANPEKVKNKLVKMGIPLNPSTLTFNQIGYVLAANMIAADGKIEPQELRVAEEAGEKIFDDFDEASLHVLLNDISNLPPVKDTAKMLKDQINQEEKVKIFKYLAAIAQSDGHIAAEEKAMLNDVALAIELDMSLLQGSNNQEEA